MAKQMSVMTTLKADISNFMSGMKKAETTAQNFSKSVKSNLDKSSKSITDFGKSMTSVGDSLTKKITKPALIATTALAGLTIGKGLGRLVGIDTAQAKLKALGHDAESLEGIMNSSLDSVRGTAFGLEEAVTTASMAVASGVETGKDLTRYLSLVGDTGAIAGASMTEMGSIFGKVQTAQRAYTGELNQLADRGIPIFQWLADEAGVLPDKIRDMASEGAISSEMFLTAIENNIGGSAKIMGDESITAGIANMGASIGRIGANFLDAGGKGGGFFSTIKPLITEFTGYLGTLEAKAVDVGVKFGESFNSFLDKIIEVKDSFKALDESTQDSITKAVSIGSAIAVGIGPAIKIVGLLATGIGKLVGGIGALFNPITLIVLAIAGLVAGLVIAYRESEVFRDGVHTVFNFIKDIVMTIMTDAVAFFQEKITQIKSFWDENGTQIKESFENVFGAIMAVVEFVMPFMEDFIMRTWESIKLIFGGALDVILGIVKTFSSLFTGDWEGVWEGIKQILSGVFGTLWELFKLNFLDKYIGILKNFASIAWETIKKVWDSILEFFKNTFNNIKEIFNNALNWIDEKTNGKFKNVTDTIRHYMQLALDNIKSIWDFIKDYFKNAIDFLVALVKLDFEGMKNAIKAQMDNIWNLIKNILNNIKNFFKNTFTSVLENTKEKFNAVKDAIMNPINSARDSVKNAIDKIKGFFSGMDLKFPKISMPKMPKFSLTGKFSLVPPSVPKVGISWNAKGGIFNKPTLFNTSNAGLQGVGEAGAEAIIPLKPSVLAGIGRGIASTMNFDFVGAINQLMNNFNPALVASAMTGTSNMPIMNTSNLNETVYNEETVNINNDFTFNVKGEMTEAEMKRVSKFVASEQLKGLKKKGF